MLKFGYGTATDAGKAIIKVKKIFLLIDEVCAVFSSVVSFASHGCTPTEVFRIPHHHNLSWVIHSESHVTLSLEKDKNIHVHPFIIGYLG